MLLIVQGNEALMELPVGIAVTGIDDAFLLRPQDCAQIRLLVIAQGCHERTHRFLGGCKAALGLGRIRGSRLGDTDPENRGRNQPRPTFQHAH